MIDFKAMFLPGQRASTDVYWIGLGLIALMDAVRVSLTGAGQLMPLWLLILLLVGVLHLNRLRDAGRGAGLALVVIGAGLAVKVLAGLGGITAGLMPMFVTYLGENGVDVTNDVAVSQATQDPALMEGFQAYLLQNEAIVRDALGAGDWPSTIAFWLTVFLIGRWYARMGPRVA